MGATNGSSRIMNRNLFPRLTQQNHQITSPAVPDYNCIAWAVGDVERWWQPGVYWPIEIQSNAVGVADLERAFESLGFMRCSGDEIELEFEKVALYGDSMFYTHASRQLSSGKWTSKLGEMEDIFGALATEVEAQIRCRTGVTA